MKSLSKVCTKCRRTLEAAAFSRCGSTRDGLQAWCKSCFKVYSDPWYTLNKKQILAEKKRQYARKKHGQSPLPE